MITDLASLNKTPSFNFPLLPAEFASDDSQHKLLKIIEALKDVHIVKKPGAQNQLSQDDIELAFRFEETLLRFLSLKTTIETNKPIYQKFYDQEMVKLLHIAKQTICKRDANFASQAAAAKGKGAQAAFNAMQKLVQGNPKLKNSQQSLQDVFLLPKQGVVFKRGFERQIEEEYLINQIFDLASKQAVVGTFNLNKADLAVWDIEALTEKDRARGYCWQALTPSLLNKISENLSGEQKQSLDYYQRAHLRSSTSRSFNFNLIYVIPDLTGQEASRVYALCESVHWTYKDEKENKTTVDFKTLQTLFLENKILIEAIQLSASSPSLTDLKKALQVKWKVVGHHILEKADGKWLLLKDVQAKPFIDDMRLLSALKYFPVALAKILARLTPDAEFNAVLTGEFQLLDLHESNLGLAPVSNDSYEKFKPLNVSVNQRTYTFYKFMLHYLDGRLKPNALIQYINHDGKAIQDKIENLTDLRLALDTRWQLAIFDMDNCLSENNHVQWQIRESTGRKPEWLIPLRSVLLELDWKDQSLSQETIERLIDSEERDLRIRNWIKREDAPILKRLSKEFRANIESDLQQLIQRVSLSVLRPNQPDITIGLLNGFFTTHLSSNYFAFWKRLEKEFVNR